MLAFMTDGQNTFHFTPNIWSKRDRQKHSISLVVLESKKTNYVSFNPHILVYASQMDKTIMTDGQTSFHHSYWYPNKTDGQTFFRPLYWNLRKTVKISFHFILHIEICARQKNYVQFHASYCRFRQTGGQTTFRFTIILRSQYERRMDFLNPSYCKLRYRGTDERTTFRFILMLESK